MPNDEKKSIVVELIQKGMSNSDISRQVGIPVSSVRAYAAHVSRGSYRENITPEQKDNSNEADQLVFGLERDLQASLRKNIDQLEEGLEIIDGGKEKIVDSGRIDILTKDKFDNLVVIELKSGIASRSDIGQILSYIGDLYEENGQVRGILIAQDFDQGARSAARAAKQLKLIRYNFKFYFDLVS